MKKLIPCEDHLGNTYNSMTDMCNHYNIHKATYKSRIESGWPLEKALILPTHISKPGCIKCKDHLGNEYESKNAMFKQYGITKEMYKSRIQHLSLKDTLTKQTKKQEYKDHLGYKYNTQKEMCCHYNIAVLTYNSRIKRGWTLKQALTEPIRKDYFKTANKYKDHLGNTYESKTNMCKNYNITIGIFNYRLKLNWPLKDILTTKIQNKGIIDHNGIKHKNKEEMCKHYNVSLTAYDDRIKSGMSIEESLLHTPKYELLKNSRMQEIEISKAGQTIKIIEYKSSRNILIKFEDGTIIKTTYPAFKQKTILNPNLNTGYRHPKVAYTLSDGTVYLYCRCKKCNTEYIGTWKDVMNHTCNNQN